MGAAGMVRRVSILWAVGVFVAAEGGARADSYKVDPVHTSVVFAVQHLTFSQVYGRFNEVGGKYSTGDEPSFDFTVKAASLDTNSAKRDEHLRSPDFFNVNQFPVIRFKSTSVSADGDSLTVSGDLTLHGVTRPITVVLRKNGEGQDPMGKYRTGYSAEFTVERSAFGMTHMLDVVGDEVKLFVSFEGVRE